MKTAVAESVCEDLLLRVDAARPRYTSYPAADRFVDAFSAEDYTQALQLRRSGAAAMAIPLSIYIHIPFCESLCYYCTLNKIITKQHDRAASYLRYLSCEVDLHVAQLGVGQIVTQLHLGGGTPTFLSTDDLRELMDMLHRSFTFAPTGEFSIEVDPRTVDASLLDTLAELGFTHLNFGVQDFHSSVQKAVHRVQSAQQVSSLVNMARLRSFPSISVDLIYGLPQQTSASLDRTLAQLIEFRPERIALHAYTHLPERFKPQRKIDADKLPRTMDKMTMQSRSMDVLVAAGYVYLGMDRFALPTDPQAVAKRQGRLHRNFQGYSTQPDCDLIGLGVSSIGHIGATYSQNAKTLEEYCDHLDQGRFPVVRGLGLSRDDVVRRAVIMALICHGEVIFESIELAHLINFRKYFASEIDALKPMVEQGFVNLNDVSIQIISTGWARESAVVVVFDRYVQTDRNRARFSKII